MRDLKTSAKWRSQAYVKALLAAASLSESGDETPAAPPPSLPLASACPYGGAVDTTWVDPEQRVYHCFLGGKPCPEAATSMGCWYDHGNSAWAAGYYYSVSIPSPPPPPPPPVPSPGPVPGPAAEARSRHGSRARSPHAPVPPPPGPAAEAASSQVLETVATLNHQFREGRPSNSIFEAGVAVRVWNIYSAIDFKHDRWEVIGTDHIAFSVINREQPWCWHDMRTGAYVLDAWFVQSNMLCAYGDDGRSTTIRGGCGGSVYHTKFLEQAMKRQAYRNNHTTCRLGLTFPQGCYNELIVPKQLWYKALGWPKHRFPIRAVVLPVNLTDTNNAGAAWDYFRLLERFKLTYDEVPFLHFNFSNLSSPFTPFVPEKADAAPTPKEALMKRITKIGI